MECVGDASDVECKSARGKTGHGPIQTGDLGRVMDGVILEIAPAPRNAVCEVRSWFCEPLNRGSSHYREPALKRCTLGIRHQRGWLKCSQSEWCEFGKHVAPCEHVCGTPCATRREYCSRDTRSESRRLHSRFRLRGKLRRAVRVRVTSPRIAQHEVQVSSVRWLTWWIELACNAIDGATLRSYVSANGKGRASCKSPPW